MHRLILAALGLLVVAAVAAGQDKPAPYKLPENARFTEEEVKVHINGDAKGDSNEKDWDIAGTLNIPGGDKPDGGWPAVLFISGSGSQQRHGVQGAIDLGTWQILDAIANAGFVVLRTDDRGVGKTPLGPKDIKPSEIGYNDLVSDARHCLRFLQARSEVNKARVFLIGHSEGGLTAPILASEDTTIAGVITLAGMGRNLYDVTLDQIGDTVAGLPKAQRDDALKAQREFQDAVKAEREPDFNILGAAVAPQLKMSWKQQVEPIKKWWREHFLVDVPKVHAGMKCPVLVLQGASDIQVKPDADARQILKDVMAGPCTEATLKIYPDLDHLFKPCGGRKSELKMYMEKRDVDPRVVKDIVAWLADLAAN